MTDITLRTSLHIKTLRLGDRPSAFRIQTDMSRLHALLDTAVALNMASGNVTTDGYDKSFIGEFALDQLALEAALESMINRNPNVIKARAALTPDPVVQAVMALDRTKPSAA